MLRPKSPDRCLVQTRMMSLKPVDGNEARADEERRAHRANAVQEDRRQGTSLPIDNRGPDRCYAAASFPPRTYRNVEICKICTNMHTLGRGSMGCREGNFESGEARH
jgi:hypothetical protein